MTRSQARLALLLLGATSVVMASFIGAAILKETKSSNNSIGNSIAQFSTSTQNGSAQKSSTNFEGHPELYPVAHIVDGDTIDVLINDKKERVRLIGLNTPETVDPRRPVQCFGPEASGHMHELLDGHKVRLEGDPVVGNRDKYGRLLAYVFRDNDTLINRSQIEEGYGFEYTYRGQNYKYKEQFKVAQESAKEHRRGLWSPATCGGMLK